MLRLWIFTALLLVVYRAAALPAPVSDTFRSPHLEIDGGAGGTRYMNEDIAAFLKSMDCPFDLTLDYLYSDLGRRIFPPELAHSPTQAYRDVYNGNIDLLSLINDAGWLGQLCNGGVIKDLSSLKFCSELKVEELFESSFVLTMQETLKRMGFNETVHLASELQQLKEADECAEMCGGRYKSVLCKAFTEMSVFLVDQVLKYENELMKDKESLHLPAEQPKIASSNNQPITPSLSQEPAGTQADTPDTTATSVGTADTSVMPENSGSPSPDIVSLFMRPTVPQAPTSDPTDSKPRTFTEEELKEALLDIFGKNLSLLKEPMEAMNTPTAVDQASDRSGLSDGPNGLDETDQAGPVVDQNELNPFAPIPGDVEKNQYDGNYYDEDGEDAGSFMDGQKTVEAAGEGKPVTGDGVENTPVTGEPVTGDGVENPPVTGEPVTEDGVENPPITGKPVTEDGVENPPITEPDPNNYENFPGYGADYNDGKVAEVNNHGGVIDNESDKSSGGYSSVHFFSIMFVLIVFAIGAYLCVHNRKKIRESIVSDSHKRRSRTRDYKPLLSGKK